MRGSLVAALDDFASKVRSLLDSLTDHERTELNSMLVHQIENAQHTLIDAILKEGIRILAPLWASAPGN